MKDNKNQKSLCLKKAIKRVLLVQLLMFIFLLLIDLYVFNGFYSSKVIIQPEFGINRENYSCEFLIQKKPDSKYLFTFKNKSLIPKYFLNYRFEEHFQNVTDTLFFRYLGRHLFPAYGSDYWYNFDCGTGLGYTSINPFESYEIEKSYDDIVKECSHRDVLKKTDYIYRRSKKDYFELKSNEVEIDSLIRDENQLVLATDSIQVEYFIIMYSFVSKKNMYTVSNRINVSIKDLLDQYKNENKSPFF